MTRLERNGDAVQIFAPAKINLFLHIVGKRPDGFHDLETLMVPITLGDDLVVEPISGTEIRLWCSDPELSTGPDNLIYQAAELFRQHFRWEQGVSFRVTKRIPVGAGLGGGSSNAAATLLALRALSGMTASDEELSQLAGQLGSDTAFFVRSQPAICRGRGEIIEPCVLAESYPGLLINPGFGVSTPWAYQSYAKNPRRGIEGKTFSFGPLRNDLEPPVLEKYLWIVTAKEWLQQRPEVVDAMMSGSGSSLFAILSAEANGENLAREFKAEFGATILALPITINP